MQTGTYYKNICKLTYMANTHPVQQTYYPTYMQYKQTNNPKTNRPPAAGDT